MGVLGHEYHGHESMSEEQSAREQDVADPGKIDQGASLDINRMCVGVHSHVC